MKVTDPIKELIDDTPIDSVRTDRLLTICVQLCNVIDEMDAKIRKLEKWAIAHNKEAK